MENIKLINKKITITSVRRVCDKCKKAILSKELTEFYEGVDVALCDKCISN